LIDLNIYVLMLLM